MVERDDSNVDGYLRILLGLLEANLKTSENILGLFDEVLHAQTPVELDSFEQRLEIEKRVGNELGAIYDRIAPPQLSVQ
ncbi:MAG: hypothetical protein Q7S31_03080 [bacterium]|nr:hypothetical protein [bacterium]